MDLISVIVPVYKVEAYLDKCVQSIVDQTYRNLEIILVDDGSPDNCGAMCDAWAEKDSRIKVIHQENQGGGMARNAGLDKSKGNVIAFVDSDDYIAPDMYEHLYSLLASDVDIAECGYMGVTGDNAVFDTVDKHVEIYPTTAAMREHVQDHLFRQVLWNKLYRRNVTESVRFPAGTGIDDEFWTYRAIGNARKLVHSSCVMYAYRQQSQSVMHTLNTERRIRAVEAKRQRHEYIVENFSELTEMSLQNLWFTCLYQGQFTLRNSNTEEATQVMDYLQTVLRKYPAASVRGTAKERIWLTMAGISLEATCHLRNLLKIGL